MQLDMFSVVIGIALGGAMAGLVAWLILRTQSVRTRADAESKIAEALSASALAQQRFSDAHAQLEAARKSEQERLQEIRSLQAQNAQGFASLKEQQTLAARIP